MKIPIFSNEDLPNVAEGSSGKIFSLGAEKSSPMQIPRNTSFDGLMKLANTATDIGTKIIESEITTQTTEGSLELIKRQTELLDYIARDPEQKLKSLNTDDHIKYFNQEMDVIKQDVLSNTKQSRAKEALAIKAGELSISGKSKTTQIGWNRTVDRGIASLTKSLDDLEKLAVKTGDISLVNQAQTNIIGAIQAGHVSEEQGMKLLETFQNSVGATIAQKLSDANPIEFWKTFDEEEWAYLDPKLLQQLKGYAERNSNQKKNEVYSDVVGKYQLMSQRDPVAAYNLLKNEPAEWDVLDDKHKAYLMNYIDSQYNEHKNRLERNNGLDPLDIYEAQKILKNTYDFTLEKGNAPEGAREELARMFAGNKRKDKMLKQFDDIVDEAKIFNLQENEIRNADPEKLQLIKQSVKIDETADDADKLNRLAKFTYNRVKQEEELRAKDNFAMIVDRYKMVPGEKETPEQFIDRVHNVAISKGLGIDNLMVMPQVSAKRVSTNLNGAKAEQIIGAMNTLEKEYGKHYPKLMETLYKEGLNPGFQTMELYDEAQRTDVLSALKMTEQDMKNTIGIEGGPELTAIKNSLDTELEDFFKSMMATGDNTKAVGQMKSSMAKTIAYMAQKNGTSFDDEIEKLEDSIKDKYYMSDRYRIPRTFDNKSVDVDSIIDEAEAVLKGRKTYNINPTELEGFISLLESNGIFDFLEKEEKIPDTVQVSQSFRKKLDADDDVVKYFTQEIKDEAYWTTNGKETGLVLQMDGSVVRFTDKDNNNKKYIMVIPFDKPEITFEEVQ